MVIILHEVPLDDRKHLVPASTAKEELQCVVGIHKITILASLLFIKINQSFFLIKV